MRTNGLLTIWGVCILAVGSTAVADLTYTNIGTLDAGWHIGSGLTADNFTIWRNTDVELGLKAHARYTGELPQSGGVYSASPGTTLFNNTLGTTWNLNVSVLLSQSQGATVNWNLVPGLAIVTGPVDSFDTFAAHEVKLYVDRDPGFDSRDGMPGSVGDSRSSIDLTGLVASNLAAINSLYDLNLGMGDIAGLQLSENVLFDWIKNAASWSEPFNPYLPGDYEFSLLIDSTPHWVDIRVHVVPIPAAALLGLLGLGAAGLGLRKQGHGFRGR